MRAVAEAKAPDSVSTLTVADAVWIAAALLQKQAGDDRSFSTEDIAVQTERLHLTEGAYRSIWQHVNQHCVANRKAQPNRACMLWATGQGNRRLFRSGDRPHPDRVGGRVHPEWGKLPPVYAELKEWYVSIWNHRPAAGQETDPLLLLAGSGHGQWDGMSAEDFVASLRTGWEAPL